jgi:hypothetical protein
MGGVNVPPNGTGLPGIGSRQFPGGPDSQVVINSLARSGLDSLTHLDTNECMATNMKSNRSEPSPHLIRSMRHTECAPFMTRLGEQCRPRLCRRHLIDSDTARKSQHTRSPRTSAFSLQQTSSKTGLLPRVITSQCRVCQATVWHCQMLVITPGS